ARRQPRSGRVKPTGASRLSQPEFLAAGVALVFAAASPPPSLSFPAPTYLRSRNPDPIKFREAACARDGASLESRLRLRRITSVKKARLCPAREGAGNPAHAQAEDQKYQSQRIALLDAVHLGQDVGGGDGQERAGGDADGDGDIFFRERAEKQKCQQRADRRGERKERAQARDSGAGPAGGQ